MIRRFIEFKNYRTIGVEALGDSPQRLLLNETDLDFNKVFGGLVILTGLNNCGKSNILDGLNSVNRGINASDIPNFIEVSANCRPKLSFCTHDTEESESDDEGNRNQDSTKVPDIITIEYLYNYRRNNLNLSESFKELYSQLEDYAVLLEEFNDYSETVCLILTKMADEGVSGAKSLLGKFMNKVFIKSSVGVRTKIGSEYTDVERYDYESIMLKLYDFSRSMDVQEFVKKHSENQIEDVEMMFNLIKVVVEMIHLELSKTVDVIDENNEENYDIVNVFKEMCENWSIYANQEYELLKECINCSISTSDAFFKYEPSLVISVVTRRFAKLIPDGIRELYNQILTQEWENNSEWIHKFKNILSYPIVDNKYSYVIKGNKSKINDNPNITVYDVDDHYNSRDLALLGINPSTVSTAITNSKFFKKLFATINFNMKKVVEIYNKEESITGVIEEFQDICNEELASLTDRFNKLYFNDGSGTYDFKLNLETNNIKFWIKDNGKSVSLDNQSIGFKWFFNFFFNMLTDSELSEGDIVILDEPATNLHAQSQIELANMIREFGIKNGITFVISTHSPFLVNIDHLDELRIISKSGVTTEINNKFTTIEADNVISPIKNALFVEEFVLLDYARNKVFVEGITDYNYLTGFKNILTDENGVSYSKAFHFVPIQGVFGTVESISKFGMLGKRYPGSILLVDDDHAGNKALKYIRENKINLNIVKLSEVHENAKQIEDLFAEADIKHASDKKFYKSANFKNLLMINNNIVSEETKDNFRKVMARLAIF